MRAGVDGIGFELLHEAALEFIATYKQLYDPLFLVLTGFTEQPFQGMLQQPMNAQFDV